MSNMAGSLCLCRDLAFVSAPSDLRIMVRASPSGVPHFSSTPQLAGVPLDRAGTSAEWGIPPVFFGAPPDERMSITLHRRTSFFSLSRDEDSCVAPFGCGNVVRARPRDNGYAFPGRSCGILHRVPILRGWMRGFLVEVALVLSAPLRCHSPGSA